MSSPDYAESFRGYIAHGLNGVFVVGDRRYDTFAIMLNTMLVGGSDPVKLMARLHGQCEIHCFVKGENRAWLADIVLKGRQAGIFRKGMGWDGLVGFLRSNDKEEVVCSHSVCAHFPEEKKWDEAFSDLQDRALELSPDNWESFRYYPDVNAFNLYDMVQDGTTDHA